ncbi:hypothetical protein RP726_05525 [Candidatus Methylospira mobilis]|uniref:hypothetical protein n=1 Tax=Candidatus Methylospira mobilis TaxID=1808979 RepID=UPI0028EA4A83|nr:hypothetical protein [Candidatus Methylospira mobilis]WNV05872.1 hypothetical protein RP726_05525 [Candidatus Methylospira mobilis]
MIRKLRYMSPVFASITLGTTTLAGLLLLSFVFGWLARSEFGHAIGFSDLVARAHALREAVYWTGRSYLSDDSNEQPTREYGFVTGVTHHGDRLTLEVYAGASIAKIEARLANTQLVNPSLYVDQIVSIRNVQAVFDFYRNSSDVVVWLDEKPWNIHLISIGAMSADKAPPTNVVDKAFAEYYWYLAKGETVVPALIGQR